MGDRWTVRAPDGERHRLVEFTDETLDRTRAESHYGELSLLVIRRQCTVGPVVGISQQILAVAEDQRLPFGAIDRMHLTNVDRMVAARHPGNDPALESRAATTEQRHAAGTDIDIDAGELLLGRLRKPL